MKSPAVTKFFRWVTISSALSSVLAQSSAVRCPNDDGQDVIGGNKKYTLVCGKPIKGRPFKDPISCRSANECARLCAAEPQCVNAQFDIEDHTCSLKGDKPVVDMESIGAYSLVFKEDIPVGSPGDSAPPSGSEPPENSDLPESPELSYACPQDDGAIYNTNGFTYRLQCYAHMNAAGPLRAVGSDSQKKCADLCSLEPECGSCDYEPAAKLCHLKLREGPPSDGASWHAWVPTQSLCPSPRPSVQNIQPEEVDLETGLQCPQNDGKMVKAADGTYFYLQCCTDTDGAVPIDALQTASHSDCMQKCVEHPQCSSATYAVIGDTNCKLYKHGQFSSTHIEYGHYLFAVDPPVSPVEASEARMCTTTCPQADGQLYISPTGENFQMACKKRHGTTYLHQARVRSYADCMGTCGAMPACLSVDYEPRTQKCYYSNDVHAPTIDAPAFMSARSLGCAGACSACQKGCPGDSQAPALDGMSCPALDRTIITASGHDYRVYCGPCLHASTNDKGPAGAMPTLTDCAKSCAENSNCGGTNLVTEGEAHRCEFYSSPDTLLRAAGNCVALVKQRSFLEGLEVTA